ncbi:glutathione S-transferase N-terminal domain-containing protein [Candidatus Woesearchaeota archaeon]|nr:glutathione S-transferase N-terminal domain-containing protein [Candidatus Woesearchaeota archaeon]
MADIKVYSTPTCPFCIKLKAWLDEKGIKYDNIDVASDQAAAQEMIRKSGQMGVPQTEINGKMIIGFDQEAIEAELAQLKPASGEGPDEKEGDKEAA